MHFTEMVAMIVTVACVFGFFAWSIAALVRIRTARYQADMQTKLLDRFGGSRELLDYLQTDAGKQFLQAAPPERSGSPHWRILRAMQAGVILTFFGIALFIGQSTVPDPRGLQLAGILITAIGLGFLLSAGLSYKFSKSWGVLDAQSKGE